MFVYCRAMIMLAADYAPLFADDAAAYTPGAPPLLRAGVCMPFDDYLHYAPLLSSDADCHYRR